MPQNARGCLVLAVWPLRWQRYQKTLFAQSARIRFILKIGSEAATKQSGGSYFEKARASQPKNRASVLKQAQPQTCFILRIG